jgi:hypothetical protein
VRAGINLPSKASGGVRHCKTKLLAFDAAIESLAHALEIEKEVEQAFEEQTNKSMLIWLSSLQFVFDPTLDAGLL